MNNNWKEQDILDLIRNQIEENLNLEYKAADALSKTADAKKKEIAKDVSALANSDGGTIIYGLKEYSDHDRRHLPEKIDPINRLDFSKEWLEQIINTNISPRLTDVRIEPITISSSPTDVVYIVSVPKSNTAHQASDKRYYKRFNFESTAMHDYEIRDVLNRAQTPIIKIEFEIETETHEVSSGFGDIPLPSFARDKIQIKTTTELIVFGLNEGRILAKYVNCFLDIPEMLIKKDQHSEYRAIDKEGKRYIKQYCENTIRDIIGFSGSGLSLVPNHGPARYHPILPKRRNKFTKISLNSNLELNSEKIFWTVYADNSEPITGEVSLSAIKFTDITKKK